MEGKENYPEEEQKEDVSDLVDDVEFLKKNKDLLLVRSHVQKLCASKGFRLKVDSIERLNKKVEMLVKEACLRAKLNYRSTVFPRDI